MLQIELEHVTDAIEYFAVYIHSLRVSGSTRTVGCRGVSCYLRYGSIPI